jgi:hypothetical protein
MLEKYNREHLDLEIKYRGQPRDEPHADAAKYRRLHVIVGDANMAETRAASRWTANANDPGRITTGNSIRCWRTEGASKRALR